MKAGIAGVAAALAIGTTGCGSSPNPGRPFECESRSGPIRTLVLLDVRSNSNAAAQAAARAADPALRQALCSGGSVLVQVDPGNERSLRSVSGLDGTTDLKVVRNNPERARRDRGKELAAYSSAIVSAVANTHVATSGSALRLLASVGRSGTPAAVTVVTSMLGHSDTNDCLNLHGTTNRPGVAVELARRCFASEQLAALPPGWSLTLTGVGAGATTRQQISLAAALSHALCKLFGPRCTVEEGTSS